MSIINWDGESDVDTVYAGRMSTVPTNDCRIALFLAALSMRVMFSPS